MEDEIQHQQVQSNANRKKNNSNYTYKITESKSAIAQGKSLGVTVHNSENVSSVLSRYSTGKKQCYN